MEHSWVNRDLFPFESKFIEIEGQQLHYVDEGTGPVILFSHGTPEWSFGWRDLICGLRGQYRCIAPDLLGFGLSDKPADADYSVRAHAKRLRLFVEKLNLPSYHLVANDFGLGIALSMAIANPEKAQKISIFNGWMWSLNSDPHYSKPAKVMQGWLGKLMYLRFNAPVNLIMPSSFGDKKKLTKEVHRHYKQALPTPASRIGAYAFTHELMNAGPFWQEAWSNLNRISDKPFLIFWGMKDKFVPAYELEKWVQALPNAKVIRLQGAGHFCQEEEPEKMLEELRVFLARQNPTFAP
jgi:haloalkane dehalogenase